MTRWGSYPESPLCCGYRRWVLNKKIIKNCLCYRRYAESKTPVCGYRRWVLDKNNNLSVVIEGGCWIKIQCLWLQKVGAESKSYVCGYRRWVLNQNPMSVVTEGGCWIKIPCLWLSKLNNSSEVPKLWWCLEIKNYPRSRLCDGDRS